MIAVPEVMPEERIVLAAPGDWILRALPLGEVMVSRPLVPLVERLLTEVPGLNKINDGVDTVILLLVAKRTPVFNVMLPLVPVLIDSVPVVEPVFIVRVPEVPP